MYLCSKIHIATLEVGGFVKELIYEFLKPAFWSGLYKSYITNKYIFKYYNTIKENNHQLR